MHKRGVPGILAVGNFDSGTGYAWGLMEKFWCEISNLVTCEGYKTYVVFPSVSKISDRLKGSECNVEEMDFTDRSFKGVLRQASYLKNRRVKILYLTDFPTFSLRYIVYRLAGVRKVIVHDHTPGVRDRPSGLKKVYKTLLNRFPWLSASACYAVSPYIERRLAEVNCVPERKIFCITNGVDPVESTRIESDRIRPFNIVTVSRASEYKGIDFALKVIKQLVEQHGLDNIHYVFYGDGPDLERFRQLSTDLSIQDYVNMPGKVSGVHEKLEQCDVAFHPSKGEAMSLALLEYMRAGLPVVVSDNPSVSSWLRHEYDSLIYPENDISAAARAIMRLHDAPELKQKLGNQGMSRVQSEFSTQAMLERFRAVFKLSL